MNGRKARLSLREYRKLDLGDDRSDYYLVCPVRDYDSDAQPGGGELSCHAFGVLLAAMLAASSVSAEEPPSPLTIGQLLEQGWGIAGYASGYDNRTSLILFRKPGINALVQCSALYDVTRNPRTVVNCYELR